jgi:DNA primase
MAEAYLASRGLALADVQPYWIGVVDNPLPGHEQFKGRLAIPYVTPTGVVDLRFRAMSEEEPKYLGLPGAVTTMFNVGALFQATNYICVCEGEIDTLVMNIKTEHKTVGVPGATNWKSHYNRMLNDFETVIVMADGDSAGHSFAQKITRELGNVRTVQMPDGEDVNSMYLKNGVEFINERIKEALGRV